MRLETSSGTTQADNGRPHRTGRGTASIRPSGGHVIRHSARTQQEDLLKLRGPSVGFHPNRSKLLFIYCPIGWMEAVTSQTRTLVPPGRLYSCATH